MLPIVWHLVSGRTSVKWYAKCMVQLAGRQNNYESECEAIWYACSILEPHLWQDSSEVSVVCFPWSVTSRRSTKEHHVNTVEWWLAVVKMLHLGCDEEAIEWLCSEVGRQAAHWHWLLQSPCYAQCFPWTSSECGSDMGNWRLLIRCFHFLQKVPILIWRLQCDSAVTGHREKGITNDLWVTDGCQLALCVSESLRIGKVWTSRPTFWKLNTQHRWKKAACTSELLQRCERKIPCLQGFTSLWVLSYTRHCTGIHIEYWNTRVL